MDRKLERPGHIYFQNSGNDSGKPGQIYFPYWEGFEAIRNWKQNAEHQEAQRLGHRQWYSSFRVRIAKVEREYGI